ncbi:MAG: hypothetical protein ONB27_08915, partial [candidate division KSB1 bacterium]|nr:hypothetical protein [candidate division KSB1 bacterium]
DPAAPAALHAQSLRWRIARRTQEANFSSWLAQQITRHSERELGAAARRIIALLQIGQRNY